MILLEIIGYQKPKAVPGVRYCLYSFSSRQHREPRKIHDIVVALRYLLEPHGKTLLLNVPHFGHRKQSSQVGIELEDSSLTASSSGALDALQAAVVEKLSAILPSWEPQEPQSWLAW